MLLIHCIVVRGVLDRRLSSDCCVGRVRLLDWIVVVVVVGV